MLWCPLCCVRLSRVFLSMFLVLLCFVSWVGFSNFFLFTRHCSVSRSTMSYFVLDCVVVICPRSFPVPLLCLYHHAWFFCISSGCFMLHCVACGFLHCLKSHVLISYVVYIFSSCDFLLKLHSIASSCSTVVVICSDALVCASRHYSEKSHVVF